MKCLISENLRSGKVQNDGTFIGQFSKSRNSANIYEVMVYVFGR